MSKYLWILDAGHGGLINGIYQTSGKRSPNWPKGIYYEGVGNRDLVERIRTQLSKYSVKCVNLHDTNTDVPLQERTKVINEMYKWNKNLRLMSIHSNAGGGTGLEVFTSPGQNESDRIAELWYREAISLFQQVPFRADRKDGDHDKEATFWMITKTNCPSILTENLFMDNINDYNLLHDPEARHRLALIHVNTILKYEGILK